MDVDNGEVWGDAHVTYPDWKGTAQLDERRTTPWPGLARTAGLDEEQWQVLGFDIGGGEDAYDLRVIAAPRDVWTKTASDDGAEIEATEFLVHGVDPLAILRQMTHVFELRMRLRAIEDRTVRIRSSSDLPTELFVEETFGPQD